MNVDDLYKIALRLLADPNELIAKKTALYLSKMVSGFQLKESKSNQATDTSSLTVADGADMSSLKLRERLTVMFVNLRLKLL